MQPMMDGSVDLEESLHLVEHGVHIAVMAMVLALSVLGAVFLVRFFLQPIATHGLRKQLVSSAVRSIGGQIGEPRGADAEVPADGHERDTFVVIPDITGYTHFMTLNRFSLGHAQYVVSRLLGAMMEAARPVLRPTHIEGDAIVFFAVVKTNGSSRGVTGDQVIGAVVDLLSGFYRERALLKHHNACRHIDDLDVKVVVHRGLILHSNVLNFESVSGISVITAKRLLKNSLQLSRYIVVTEAAAEAVPLPLPLLHDRHVEHVDGFGDITARVYAFDPDGIVVEPEVDDRTPLSWHMQDLMSKFAKNARAVGRSFKSSG